MTSQVSTGDKNQFSHSVLLIYRISSVNKCLPSDGFIKCAVMYWLGDGNIAPASDEKLSCHSALKL